MKTKLIALLFLSAICVAQDKPKELKPTDFQQAKLESAQKDVIIQNMSISLFQKQLDEAKAQSQSAFAKLVSMCADVVKENKWPAGTTCAPDTLKFTAPTTVTPPQVKKESK